MSTERFKEIAGSIRECEDKSIAWQYHRDNSKIAADLFDAVASDLGGAPDDDETYFDINGHVGTFVTKDYADYYITRSAQRNLYCHIIENENDILKKIINQSKETLQQIRDDKPEWLCSRCRTIHLAVGDGFLQPCPVCNTQMELTSFNIREISRLKKECESLHSQLAAAQQRIKELEKSNAYESFHDKAHIAELDKLKPVKMPHEWFDQIVDLIVRMRDSPDHCEHDIDRCKKALCGELDSQPSAEVKS